MSQPTQVGGDHADTVLESELVDYWARCRDRHVLEGREADAGQDAGLVVGLADRPRIDRPFKMTGEALSIRTLSFCFPLTMAALTQLDADQAVEDPLGQGVTERGPFQFPSARSDGQEKFADCRTRG